MTQPSPAWQSTASMAFPRSYLNLTILPDGQVLATGGGTTTDKTNLSAAVLAAEMWSPTTEAWTTLSSEQIPRLYHSIALLLPDARVLVAGGGRAGCAHPCMGAQPADEPSAEIFSPPYLFDGPRPVIASAPGYLRYGTSFSVTTPDASRIALVSLIPLGSVTHAFNENQRFVPLAFEQAGASLTVHPPADGRIAPPGPYMLFLVDNIGVPSVAAMVNLSVATGGPDLTITKQHSGSFAQGQAGSYTLTVTNSGSAATSGSVSVVDSIPSSLNATAISGSGWSCTLASLTCTRSDVLAPAASYAAITVNVTVAAGAPSSVTNTATVSGGGETNTANNTASDPTTITSGTPTAITLLQHASKDAGAVNSSTLAFPGGNTAGNWLAVIVRAGTPNSTLTITDTLGNVYKEALVYTETVDGDTLGIFYAENILAGTNIITVNSSSGGTLRFAILEYAGVARSTSLDGTMTARGTSATPSTGTFSTGTSGDLLLGMFSTSNGTTFTAGGGFTIVETVPSAPDSKLMVEDIRQTTATSIVATATLSSSDAWGAAAAAFRAAVGVPPPPVITSPTSASGTVGSAFSYQITATNSPTSYGATGLPAGLSINATGLISGIPTTPGTSAVTLSATNNGGTGSATLTLTINNVGPPVITSATSASGTVGIAFSYQITATNSPTSYGATGLPAGLSINTTGLISGTPTTPGTSTVTLSATNGVGTSTATLTLTINSASSTITYVQGSYAVPQTSQTTVTVTFPGAQTASNLIVAVVGWNDTTATVTAITDSRGNTYKLAVGPTIRSGFGSQSIYYASNIAAAAAGTNVVTVRFSSPAQYPDVRILEYAGADPNNPIDVTAASSGNSGTSSSGTAKTTNATDLIFGANLVQTTTTAPGTGFTTRLLTSPDGDIAEDQMVTAVGSYSATAALSSGQWIMQMVAIRTVVAAPLVITSATRVVPAPPVITSATSASGTVGSAFLNRITATNSPTSFGATGLPAGLSIDASGLISGTPTSSGTSTVTLSATNSGGTDNATLTLTIGTSVSPRTTVLTFTRTQQFVASDSNVTWLVDGVAGGSTSSGSITRTGLYTPPASTGTHTVTAVNQAQISTNATVYVVNYAGTFTRDVDTLRTGLNSNETVLTPANVNASKFGKLFTYPIDGTADASPLYVANVNFPGQGFHNVVYVATEHDSVYAFDADGLQTVPLWQVSFINPATGITTVPPNDTGECCDISPEIGITGSPVIDPATNTLYVVAKTKEVSGTTKYFHRLHALDITTGAEKFGGPVIIQPASVPGTGSGSLNGVVPFISLHQNQLAALLLNNGVVYVAFGAHGNVSPYHGWIVGFNASTLQQVMQFCTSPNDNGVRLTGGGQGSGVWQGGDGLATDSTGSIYFVTGNGTFDVNTGGSDYGDSFVKISSLGGVLDYFTPFDQQHMNDYDIDLGSGGVLLLPDQPGTHPHLAATAGKNGTIYLIDRDNMGRYNPNNNNQIVQSMVSVFPNGNSHTGNFRAPVYWNGNLYYSADADFIKAFRINNGLLTTVPTAQSSVIAQYPGSTLGLSSYGNTNAILWAIQRVDVDPIGGGIRGPGILHAFDATNIAVELYNSNQAGGNRDTLDLAAKWSAPLVANGKVYTATLSQLQIYGLLP